MNETPGNSLETQNDILLYPNPASQQLNIGLPNNIEGSGEMIVYDLLGKIVLDQRFEEGNKVSIEVTGLEEGMYVMRIETREISLQKIFLVKR
jgi:hypothetical protein